MGKSCGQHVLFSLGQSNAYHPSFFISKKVQVEWPELDSGGNARKFIEILNYAKLEIVHRGILKIFAILWFTYGFSQDRTSDLQIQRSTPYPFGHQGERIPGKKFYKQVIHEKNMFDTFHNSKNYDANDLI